MSGAKRLLQRVGMDRTIGYSLLAQAWTIFSGPLTLWFIASHLSSVEQGFYYVFSSILGLQVFLELGTGFVLLQFSSQEKAHLEWTPGRTLTGDESAKARLASLLRRSLAWYGVLAGLLVVLLLPVGWLFIEKSVANSLATAQLSAQSVSAVRWQGPWVWLVLVTAGNLILSPLLCLLQGCGIITEFALLRLGQNVLTSLVSWSLLALGFHLFALPAFSMAGALLALAWVASRYGPMFRDLWRFRHEEVEINWKRDVWPFQWKIALTSVSAFFMHQSFTPILFAFRGPIVAGQFGMTNTILSAVAQGGASWINTRFQPICVLVARKKWRELDALFFRSLWQSFVLVALAMLGVVALIVTFQTLGFKWGARFLPPVPLILLVVTLLVIYISSAQSLYLRAHRQDPMLPLSLLAAALVALCSYFGGRYFGASGMMWSYLWVSLICVLGAGTWVFQQKRREWHTSDDQPNSQEPLPPAIELETLPPIEENRAI